jgi:tyrosyl-tRNA synthetase
MERREALSSEPAGPMTAPAAGPDGPLSTLLDDLRWRGLVHATSAGLPQRLATGAPIAAYNGFDPTAASLHVGHLVPAFGLMRLQRRGVRPVALVGGATGMVGDPSGRSSERVLLDRDVVDANAAAIRRQLERFLDFSPGPTQAEMANNLDWLGSVRLLDFLRDIGKHFTIPYMLAKDSVQLRLAGGLSFTEFSYMLLQSADFLHLYREHGVELQAGGADQWGNITAGMELIRRVEGRGEGHEPAHGLSYPLLLTPSGAKFGKSDGGESVWLDSSWTSPYRFYQYWIDADDRDVSVYLRWFTLMGRDEIEALEAERDARPETRAAQRALARDITERIHGREAADEVARVSGILFGGDPAHADAATLEAVAREIPTAPWPDAEPRTVTDVAIAAGAAASRGEARRLVDQGGLTLNGRPATDAAAGVGADALLAGRFLLVRRGRRDFRMLVRGGAPR